MKYSYLIDWFTGVVDSIDSPKIGSNVVASQWIPVKGRMGYDIAHEDYTTGIIRLSSSSRSDMGTCFVASGKPLGHLLTALEQEDYVTAMCMYGLDWCKCARIDLTLDIHDHGRVAHIFSKNLSEGRARFTARKSYTIQSTDGSNGVSSYIGSRDSPRFLRFYDKRAESKGKISTSRIELECKDNLAALLWRRLYERGDNSKLASVVMGAITGFVTDFGPGIDLSDCVQAENIELPKREEKNADVKEWLTKQVVPTLVKSARDEIAPGDLLSWLIHTVRRRVSEIDAENSAPTDFTDDD